MKTTTYVLYGLWAISGIVLASLKIITWWVGLSFLWIPFTTTLSLGVMVFLLSSYGTLLKRKAKNSLPECCSTCLFKKGSDLIQERTGKPFPCLGEKHNLKHGEEPCEYYTRG